MCKSPELLTARKVGRCGRGRDAACVCSAPSLDTKGSWTLGLRGKQEGQVQSLVHTTDGSRWW